MQRLLQLKEQYLKNTFKVEEQPKITEERIVVDRLDESELSRGDEASFALTTSHVTAN